MKSMKKTFLGTGIALTLLSACAPKQSQETLTKSGLNPTNYETIVDGVKPVKLYTLKNAAGMEVCVIKPRSMEDTREITDTLLASCTVVLNMEGLDVDIAQRIIDFASGSCYAIDGNLQKVSNFIFIITPSGVEVSGDFQEILNGVDMPSLGNKF